MEIQSHESPNTNRRKIETFTQTNKSNQRNNLLIINLAQLYKIGDLMTMCFEQNNIKISIELTSVSWNEILINN